MSRKFLAVMMGVLFASLTVSAQPTFTISNTSADPGTTVDIDFTVDDYTDYISLQFSVNWDPSVLAFLDVSNLTDGLPGFSEASSLNPDSTNGTMTVSWFEGSVTPTSLPNGTNVFTLQFEVIGQPCDSSGVIISDNPLAIEIADENEMNVGANINQGFVTVPGVDCGTFNGLRIIGSQEVAANGSQVCVQFTSEGFNSIGGAQYTINFDPAVLEFAGVQNINWPGVSEAGSFGTTGAANGEVTFVWFDQNAVGVDLPDGTILYELCFNVVGTGGQMSQVSFGDEPLEIEISDGNGMIVDFEGVPGKVTVEGMVEGFALISQDGLMAALNEIVCVDVSVNDFIDIVSMQFSVNWDSTVLQFDHVEGFNLPDFNENNVAGPEAPGNNGGQMTVVWIDQALAGVTRPNGETIFSICFRVVGECDESTSVQFTSDPLEIEVSDINDIVPVSQAPGTFTVTCGCGANIVSTTNPCPGECSGSIDVTVFGCAGPITYAWSNGATTEDQSDLCAGNYVVTITTGDGIIILDTIRLTEPASLSVSASITDAMEGGDGAIALTINGGTPPYGFLWNDPDMSITQNISGLDAGEYSVTITDDQGCVYTAGPFEVRDGGAVSADVTDVACFGGATGSIEITGVNCGLGPYTYLWSNDATTETISDLPAGTYGLTVTGSDGTTCETSFTVDQADSAISIGVDTTNETSAGNDGSIDLTVSGGQEPYTYVWSTGAMTEDLNGLSAGEYVVTVTDQFGCAVVETILIRGNEIFVELMVADFNTYGVSCFGECDGEIIAASVNGVGMLTYSWSNGASSQAVVGLCAGVYTVTVTDELGQSAEATVEVTEPPALTLSLEVTDASEPGSSDGGATAIVSGGVPPYNYQWGDGSTNGSVQNQPPGPVVVFVTDENNCEVMQQSSIGIQGIPCYSAISVITPNGDGKNDQFVVQCIFDLPNRLNVFNRYGGLEFEMNNYDNSWEGTDNEGEQLSDGGYHWVLEVFLNNGDRRIFEGTVAIVRSLD